MNNDIWIHGSPPPKPPAAIAADEGGMFRMSENKEPEFPRLSAEQFIKLLERACLSDDEEDRKKAAAELKAHAQRIQQIKN